MSQADIPINSPKVRLCECDITASDQTEDDCLPSELGAPRNSSAEPDGEELCGDWELRVVFVVTRKCETTSSSLAGRESRASEGFFRGGPIVDFFRGSQKDFSRGDPESGEILFFFLETKKTTLLAKNVRGKCHI